MNSGFLYSRLLFSRFLLVTPLVLIGTAIGSGFCSGQGSAAAIVDSSDKPSFWLKVRGSELPEPRLQFRRGADAMLEINALSLLGEKDVDEDSAIWKKVHGAIAEYVETEGDDRKLHIRFYHSDYLRSRKFIKRFHETVKKKLSDLSIAVVVVDEKVRNDHLPWKEYLSREWAKEGEADDRETRSK